MPAPERVPSRVLLTSDAVELLAEGKLTVRGRVREASNAVLYCAVERGDLRAMCVYKPAAGERPLWDFPHGSLARREVAAFLVSEALGWGLVPPTVLRDGPFGEGMCQLWIDADPQVKLLALQEGGRAEPGWRAVGPADLGQGRPTALLAHADDERLRRLAVLDAVINNADRKGGHLLPTADGQLYGIDHGVAFHTEDKLRTLLWGWAGEALPVEAITALQRLRTQLDCRPPGEGQARGGRSGGDRLGDDTEGAGTAVRPIERVGEREEGVPLRDRLGELLTTAEVSAMRRRVVALLTTGRHPEPGGSWPVVPWPPI